MRPVILTDTTPPKAYYHPLPRPDVSAVSERTAAEMIYGWERVKHNYAAGVREKYRGAILVEVGEREWAKANLLVAAGRAKIESV